MSVRTFLSLWRKCLSMDVLNYWNNLHVSTYFLIIMEKAFEYGRLKDISIFREKNKFGIGAVVIFLYKFSILM